VVDAQDLQHRFANAVGNNKWHFRNKQLAGASFLFSCLTQALLDPVGYTLIKLRHRQRHTLRTISSHSIRFVACHLGAVTPMRIVGIGAASLINPHDMVGHVSCVDIEWLGVFAVLSGNFEGDLLFLLGDRGTCRQGDCQAEASC
jgi:hypothetical protein